MAKQQTVETPNRVREHDKVSKRGKEFMVSEYYRANRNSKKQTTQK